ncbi:helix-turn-helix domain-containing protein [Nostoc sp. 2RC]|uniref:helix-turn-helix domain-containing protein n=1 Tax=Nostoc sp. 2RC TaxID=2485484 RepID=UPI001627A999|nr:helix-turn-helix domain-containing protein [Nostoc sp. 2RC]MBC1240519.1 helix-turn-helix domain-containing protein [Nostoc sp. 2RC]
MTRAKKNKEAGEAFKKLLKEKKFTQYKLEQVTGLDKSVISKIATGQTANPTPTTLEKIAVALGVELGELTRIFAQSTVQSQPQESVSNVSISNNSDFVGREEAIAHLDKLVNEGAKVILIHAEGGIGKTTLATKWFELQGLECLKLRVGSTPQNLNSVQDWLRLKLRDCFNENPEENFMIMLEQLKTKLQIRKIGVLIDNLEPALINGKFIKTQQSYYIELLTVLAHHNVKSVTLITSREQIQEHTLKRLQTFKSYSMKGLEKEAWQQYFEIFHINIDSNALSKMHQAYGGNA